MKTVSDFANLLNGREYGYEMTRDEESKAKAAGIVVVFGYSDDNMELRGAINDEIGCYDGGEAYVCSEGLLTNRCECDDCPYFANEQWKWEAGKITAVWGAEGYSWVYQTKIPHETFNILEDGELYCRGIVFLLSDIATATGA